MAIDTRVLEVDAGGTIGADDELQLRKEGSDIVPLVVVS
jgi:hypothetical protein